MTRYIAYYRVSTERQGRAGLGMEAQQRAVAAFLQERDGELIAEFTEVESGRRNDRPQLHAALQACKKQKAQLVIAKLDRLARNVAFISGMMEAETAFVAVDMPQANRFMLHIIAAVAEYERELISQRIIEAMAVAKIRGVKMGNPRPAPSLARGRETIAVRLEAHRQLMQPLIVPLRESGLSLRAVAGELNRRGIKTVWGRQWAAATVNGMLKRAASPPVS